MNINSTNMKLLLFKFIYVLLSSIVIIFLASCSILDYEEDKSNSKFSKNNINENKCPSTKIPSETASYISAKKYILNIKKIEMACKSELVRGSDALNIIVQYKAKMELKTNNKIKKKDLILPDVYIALVDRENEAVLAKMTAEIDIINQEGNAIVNEKKFRIKNVSKDNLYIYFGLQ